MSKEKDNDIQDALKIDDTDEFGNVRIADEVICIIAGLATTEVQGVAGMSGGLVGGIADLLGKKNLSKGVNVNLGDKQVAIDLHVILEYGISIPDVAMRIQEQVKEAVENMSGMQVAEINIYVEGISTIDKVKERQTKAVVD